MVKVNLYKKTGKTEKTLELNKDIFDLEYNKDLLAQAVLSYLSNQRKPNAHTKDRSEVSGGGKKPFKQKGTGRARAGSSRSPLWTGGGITFGPRNDRNFKKSLSKKMKIKAVLTALSYKVRENEVLVIDEFKDLKEISTKNALKELSSLPISDKKVVLIINKDYVNIQKSLRNVKNISVERLDSLNTYSILNNKYLVIPQNIIEDLEKKYLKSEKKVKSENSKKSKKDK